MGRVIAGACAGLLLWAAAGEVRGQAGIDRELQGSSTIVVQGHGQVAVAPDQVVISMGAVAQADRADFAQHEVNRIMQKALAGITALGVPARQTETVGIALSPVYYGTAPAATGGAPMGVVQEPRVVGYRASNTLRIQLSNLRVLGQVIDAAVNAGASQLEDLTFQLKDDTPYRQQAYSKATADARAKAEAIARTMGVQIVGVRQAQEAGVQVIRPQMEYRQLPAADAVAATPIQPGQIRFDALVNVTYLLGPLGSGQ